MLRCGWIPDLVGCRPCLIGSLVDPRTAGLRGNIRLSLGLGGSREGTEFHVPGRFLLSRHFAARPFPDVYLRSIPLRAGSCYVLEGGCATTPISPSAASSRLGSIPARAGCLCSNRLAGGELRQVCVRSSPALRGALLGVGLAGAFCHFTASRSGSGLASSLSLWSGLTPQRWWCCGGGVRASLRGTRPGLPGAPSASRGSACGASVRRLRPCRDSLRSRPCVAATTLRFDAVTWRSSRQ